MNSHHIYGYGETQKLEALKGEHPCAGCPDELSDGERCVNDDQCEAWEIYQRGTDELNLEICVICGKSVAWGSDKFVNRIGIADDYETRKECGHPHPEGEWMCEECELALEHVNNY